MLQVFLNKFRCDIDLWEAEVAEKKTLRSTMLQQLEAEWDARDMHLLSPSSFLRGNTITAEVNAFPSGPAQGVSHPASLADTDIDLRMTIARGCISWLHAALSKDEEMSKTNALDWTDRVFVTSLLPHQARQVGKPLSSPLLVGSPPFLLL